MTEVQLVGWRQRAKCAGLDTELFYPEPATGAAKREAKAVCTRCDVRLECLLDALATKEQFGIRGGLTARERRTMTRRLRQEHGIPTRPLVAATSRGSPRSSTRTHDTSDTELGPSDLRLCALGRSLSRE